MPPLDILGSFQDPKNLDEGAGKLINVRVVPRQPTEGKPAKARFVGAPGLPIVCKPTAAPCIAISHALGTIWTGHADGSIYRGVETGAPTPVGFVAVNVQQPIIRFAEDRTALAIATNSNLNNPAENGTGYVATFGGVANANLDGTINFDPSTVAELNNITVWSGASNFYSNQNAKMYSSEPLAPATVLPNSFATKEARADRVVDLAVSGLVLWPLGARSLEQWYAPGGQTDFAFVAYPNSLYSVGIAARTSLAVLRDIIMFVATDRRIWLCTGQTGQPVSPPWVDLLLQQLTANELSLLTAYAYGQGGGDFYVLTMPGQWTLELCGTTRVWAYRKTPGIRLDHAGRCATEAAGGITYVGLDTGEVCALDINNSAEPAGTLQRTITTPWVGSEETRQTYNSIDVTSTMGPAAGSFQLDWSEDKAVTWRGARQIIMPQPGTRRAIGREFGTGRRRQFRLQYGGAQAPFTIDELFANVSGGT